MEIAKIKDSVYGFILNGTMSIDVLNIITNAQGEIVPKECELWDFKKTFTKDPDAYLDLLKSIVSFHNTYGGYLFFGIEEEVKDTKFSISGIEKGLIDQQYLRGRFDSFFSQRLDLTYIELDVVEGKTIGILHIPKRKYTAHTVSPTSMGSSSKNKIILSKDAVYFRKMDECKQVISQSDFEFIVSPRDFISEKSQSKVIRKNIIAHNLPDKNFICPFFIGRTNILQELWGWLADEFQYTKILAADGGKGKTSIAYEFSQRIVNSGTTIFDQVIWLTAKKKQFKASYNSYLDIPETHYQDLNSLLKEICLRTGSLPDEIEQMTIHQLQRTAKQSLELIPSFIVVDDIDSNALEEQKRIMDAARIIACSRSRILMTTRANNIFSSDASIIVPGLQGNEYTDLVVSMCKMLDLPPYNINNINKLHKASEGSPLFTESVLRLCKLGMSIDNAINDWNGKSGDAVREAALKKEISELSPEAVKVLLTIAFVGSLSRIELHQYTDLENIEITDAIERLDSLFLIKGQQFIEKEPRFETTSSISKLMLSISEEIIPNAKGYLARIAEIAKGLEENAKNYVPEIASAIRQCNALIREERYDDAKQTVNNLLKKPRYKENADLYFMLAKTFFNDSSTAPELIRKSCRDAFLKGQKKTSFFEMWFLAETQLGTKNSIVEVCEHALESITDSASQKLWSERYAYAGFELALTAIDYNVKIKNLIKSYSYAARTMRNSKKPKWDELKALSIKIVDRIWNDAYSHGDVVIAAKTIINAVNEGDKRGVNFSRLIQASDHYIENKIVHKNDYEELLNCLLWSQKILSASDNNREEWLIKIINSHKRMQDAMSEKYYISETSG
ncbi:RNA-binding domain-containing protein [Aeromonas veronii]|uniref:RNA-binding domain-containing protein n=1 Tax=Aeromonas veronii TaxID=654 RepID=UPI002416895E|nr:RNA-binding domain-containing protein [Aeromonas veronii]WFO52649.1 putative DNA binding domain-containing protein [Aeromonas veronii]